MTGNRKHYYYYDMGANKLEKIPGIQGGVFSNTSADNMQNLSRLFVGSNDFYAFAGGDQGNIAVMSQKSKKLLFELKLSSSSCTSLAFSPNEQVIYAVGDQSDIYAYDLRHTKRCLNKVSDEGSFNTTHVTASPDGGMIATGSKSGVVNIWKIEDGHNLTLIKSVLNLTTAVTDLKFD